MAKKPTFKLYRICNKENGMAFQGWIGTRFTPLGAFFRSPETIRKHLRMLTHELELTWCGAPKYTDWKMLKEIPDEYKKYYVEVYSVTQLSMHTEEAAKYLGKVTD